MFNDIMPIGQYIWTPSSKVLFDDDNEDDDIQNVNDDDNVNLKEESNDSDNDSILNLAYDVCDMVVGVDKSIISTIYSSGKRKNRTF